MCNMGYCYYEEDITMSCENCPYNVDWVESDYVDCDDYDDFDLYEFDII